MRRYFNYCRFLAIAVIVISLSGCKTVKVIEQVPVYLKDTTHETHTEYIFKTDTVINNTEIIIREATASDSALLAQLGLQLKDNERTILVLRNELLEKIQLLEQSQTDSIYQHDEKPVTVSKTETGEVKKPLRWWQKTLMWAGVAAVMALIGVVIWKTKKWWIKLFV